MVRRIFHSVILVFLISACGKQEDHSQHAGHNRTNRNEPLSKVTLPANRVVLSSQKTIKPSQRLIEKTVTTNGYISFDERRNNTIAVRVSGRIEKLYVRYNYQYVKQGQTIAELYSPELRTYQEEYLFMLKTNEKTLAEKTKDKLKLLGLTEHQILELVKQDEVKPTITITSPVEGFIRFLPDPVSSSSMQTSPSSMGEMASAASANDKATQATSSIQIREGVYVSEGQTLFIVNDCRKVWAILSAESHSQAGLRIGTPVTLYSELQPEPITARIDFVEPRYQDNQRFTQVRVYLDNPARVLKINSLIKGNFFSQDQSLTIPASSVFDLGTRKIVWVKTGMTRAGVGLFEARELITDTASNGIVTVINGLEGDEEIALDAGYMLDSESILTEKE